ncbi:hypothetical protein VC34_28590 [Pseudomonas fluorescens]|uniref:Uncharacterized protein n=1 Tax=Pseudomonas fluorescens TaxID=294 RepID=A0A0F4STR1_PSEFL|nr:hypothetical protein VC34_28590 [Pseudomonas fluorescens]
MIFSIVSVTEEQDQKIAAFGSSYVDRSVITSVSIGTFIFVYKITTAIEQSLTRNANVAASLRSEVRAC